MRCSEKKHGARLLAIWGILRNIKRSSCGLKCYKMLSRVLSQTQLNSGKRQIAAGDEVETVQVIKTIPPASCNLVSTIKIFGLSEKVEWTHFPRLSHFIAQQKSLYAWWPYNPCQPLNFDFFFYGVKSYNSYIEAQKNSFFTCFVIARLIKKDFPKPPRYKIPLVTD